MAAIISTIYENLSIFLASLLKDIMRIVYKKWTVYTLGDHAIVFALSPIVSPAIAASIGELNAYVQSKKIAGIKDIIPSYHSLTLIIDILSFEALANTMQNGLEPFCTQLLAAFELADKTITNHNRPIIQVPVCYDTSLGLDLNSIIEQKNIPLLALIQLHCETIYTVYCIGFLPGFAYMGSVPTLLQIPRHASPRNEVAAGSVGIAGIQTGIYPSNSPGGWQIIGRTPEKIFDPHPSKLAKFKVGDQVKFYPISLTEFNQLNQYR
jgi:inhibitor of KinA